MFFLQGTGSQIIDFFDDFSLPLCLMFVGFFNMLFVFYAFGKFKVFNFFCDKDLS